MGIAADTGDALYSEIKRRSRETGFLQEGHDKTAETAVDVHTRSVFFGEFAKSDNVVLATVGKINCRTYKLHRTRNSEDWRTTKDMDEVMTMIVLGFLENTRVLLETRETTAREMETDIARRMRLRSAWRVTGSTGILWHLILRYAAALSKAAWAVKGTMLSIKT